MKAIYQFIKDFKERSGLYILSGNILEKASNFFISWLLIKLLDKATLGQLSYAQSVMIFIFSMVGLGTNSALLQIGSGLKSQLQKYKLMSYAFYWGMAANVLMMAISLILSVLLSSGNQALMIFFILLAVQIIPQYITGFQSTWYRMSFKNRELYQYDIRKIGIQLGFSFVLIYFFKAYGYLAALIITPILLFVFYSIKFPLKFIKHWELKDISEKYFWKFSIYSGLSMIVSQVVFVVDAVIIFSMLGDEANAEYRVASIIPFNLLFIPLIFMKTDYATIAKHKEDQKFLWQYYSRYFVLMFAVSLIIFLIGYFFGDRLLEIFGNQYHPYPLFIVLLFSSCVAMMFRVPLGNIISALGNSAFNFYNSLITITIDIVLNLYLIPKFGLMGAAYATAVSLIFSGLLSLIYFIIYVINLSYGKDS